MKITRQNQLDDHEVFGAEYDLLIATSGYESRAPYISERLAGSKIGKRVVLGLNDRKVDSREINDIAFKDLEFDEAREFTATDGAIIGNLVADEIYMIRKRSIKLAIDYSSMPKTWYAGIILSLFDLRSIQEVEVVFLYAPSEFVPPGPAGMNNVAMPLDGYCRLEAPELPSALVLGLGYEPIRAMGIRDFIDPNETFMFYTDPAMESKFTDAVLRNNEGLLDTVGKQAAFPYPMADLDYTSALLTNLVLGLKERFRIIVAPLGPKPFCLLTLLLAKANNVCDVWRVSSGTYGVPHLRPPLGPVLAYRVCFSSE